MHWARPWLWLPPRLAHDWGPYFLNISRLWKKPKSFQWKTLHWQNLRFENPLGVAGGVDKNAQALKAWWGWGPGFVEVGTVTPLPQGPNPGKILLRSTHDKAVWNKMGFPNLGMDYVADRLSAIPKPYPSPLFVNVGKNRNTPIESAAQDYIMCLRKLASFADAFVINISSPNTEGLRRLLEKENLAQFLKPILEENARNRNCPLLLKISPDMSEESFLSLLQSSSELGISGWILTNTTLDRAPGLKFPREGGVSGQPLAEKSKSFLKLAKKFLESQKQAKILVSCGGVLTPEDVAERLELGADLVQVYTALIFSGPGFFKKVAQFFRKLKHAAT